MSSYFNIDEDFTVPNNEVLGFVSKLVDWYFVPEYVGIDTLKKDKPALYVSNHTLLGLTDGPLYIPEIYHRKDIFLRVLVDKMHESVPVWRGIMSDYGTAIGSKENCRKLMEQKQHILVFPGGANEVCKKKGEEYRLVWKERYGFAKLAIEAGYPIIPISGLGGDELYDIIWDKEDIMDSKLGTWLKETGWADKYFKGGENIPPIVKGIGPTLFPKPKKIYYKFGKPIATKAYKGKVTESNLKELREKVEHAIYEGISEMRQLRANQPEDSSGSIRKFLNGL